MCNIMPTAVHSASFDFLSLCDFLRAWILTNVNVCVHAKSYIKRKRLKFKRKVGGSRVFTYPLFGCTSIVSDFNPPILSI